MEPYVVLEKALALIEDEKNWCQGEAFGGGSRVCAVGAIYRTLDDNYFGTPAHKALTEAAVEITGMSYMSVPTFNDTHSHAEVVALFQKAIAQEKRKAGVLLDIPTERNQDLTKQEEPVRGL